MIIGFAHPCLVVENSKSVRDFYCAMFGFTELSEEGWADSSVIDSAVGVQNSAVTGYMLAGPNCFLEIHEYLSPKKDTNNTLDLTTSYPANTLGIRHLAFQVDDCLVEAKRFTEHGGVLFSEPVEMVDGVYAVYGRDPFGHIIELCEPVTSSEHLASLSGVRYSNNLEN